MNTSVNQYTSRTVPSYIWEMGSANSNATVTINNLSTARKGIYFAGQLSVNNTASATYAQLVTVGVLKDAGSNQMNIVTTQTGHVFVAQSPEQFGYDVDGNLTSDGRWSYSWDGENRLIGMQTTASAVAAGAPNQKLLFGYDYQSRRVSKVVSNYTGGAWVAAATLQFVYDGWNLLAELNQSNVVVRSYVWGLDLSGSMQGAGGIGGLLWTSQSGGGTSFIAHDGNGNVTSLLNTENSQLNTSYEYGPFGELIRASGASAGSNPFRFSTHYFDQETGLLYAKNRYYQPSTGRWVSRDPSGEGGGLNLYALVYNNPLSLIDPLGLWKWEGGKRDGNARATVIAEKCGDKYDDLAKLVGLESTEVQKWLETWKPNDQVTKDEKFTVPNTVYMMRNYDEYSVFVDAWMIGERIHLGIKGYNVVGHSQVPASTILDNFKDKDTYGIVFVGHGDDVGWITANGQPISSAEAVTHHKLGALVLAACYAGKDPDWRTHVSSSGFFWATSGDLPMWWFVCGRVKAGF